MQAFKAPRAQPVPTSGRASPVSSSTSPSTIPALGHHQIRQSLAELASAGKLQRLRYPLHPPDRANDDKPLSSDASSKCVQARQSIDMTWSENASPVMSPNHSRRTSVLVQREGDQRLVTKGPPSPLLNTDKLRQSFTELETFSTTTIRQLDELCFAVQDNTMSLQNIVNGLKELAETSRDIQISFESVAHELEADILNQLDALGEFQGQQNAIEVLQRRIHTGRQRIEALAARVDVVRRRVESWEKADMAWQERTRKRLRVIWTALSVVALVFLVFLVSLDYGRGSVPRGGQTVLKVEGRPTAEPKVQNVTDRLEGLTGTDTKTKVDSKTKTETKLVWKAPADEGDWLRAFDEL